MKAIVMFKVVHVDQNVVGHEHQEACECDETWTVKDILDAAQEFAGRETPLSEVSISIFVLRNHKTNKNIQQGEQQ